LRRAAGLPLELAYYAYILAPAKSVSSERIGHWASKAHPDTVQPLPGRSVKRYGLGNEEEYVIWKLTLSIQI
jgi:hypothetical protein